MKTYSNIYYYDLKGELIKLNECIIHNLFTFDRQNFILLSKNNRYYICIEHSIIEKKKNNILLSFWGHSISDDLTPSDIVSLFRKEYKKNKINNDLLLKYLDNPLKYSLLKNKKNGKKTVS